MKPSSASHPPSAIPSARPIVLAFLTVLIVTWLLPYRLDAQTDKDGPRPSPAEVPGGGKRISGEFEQVQVSEIIQHLRETFPDINFVLAPPAGSLTVTMHMRNVTLEGMLQALVLAANEEILCEQMEENLFLIRPAERVRQKAHLMAFNLAPYLQGRTEEEIPEALQALEELLQISWQMLEHADENRRGIPHPQLKIHEKTSLLLVVGREEQLEVISQVIQALVPSRQTRSHLGGARQPEGHHLNRLPLLNQLFENTAGATPPAGGEVGRNSKRNPGQLPEAQP